MQFRRSDLTDLSYFVEIVKHRNFRRAGLELGLSSSALSHALRGLEERIGVRKALDSCTPANRWSVTCSSKVHSVPCWTIGRRHIYYASRRQMPAALRLFIELVRELQPIRL